MSQPFQYPDQPIVRRHGPVGYADYESYRPWLRDQFCFRCVYCLLREAWVLQRGSFAIDHFVPVAIDPKKANDYDNLVYACSVCNLGKGQRIVPDPCEALYRDDVEVLEDGTIVTTSDNAKRIVRVLGLDSPEYNEFRRLWIDIIALVREKDVNLCRRLLGFPDDLPDLKRLRPPGGNTRPKGITQSFFEQRKRDEIPESF